jgi:hypothetical protein
VGVSDGWLVGVGWVGGGSVVDGVGVSVGGTEGSVVGAGPSDAGDVGFTVPDATGVRSAAGDPEP